MFQRGMVILFVIAASALIYSALAICGVINPPVSPDVAQLIVEGVTVSLLVAMWRNHSSKLAAIDEQLMEHTYKLGRLEGRVGIE